VAAKICRSKQEISPVKLIAAALILAATAAHAEDLPDAPSPSVSVSRQALMTSTMRPAPEKPVYTKYDYALYAGIVAYRVGDFITTEYGHSFVCPEAYMPQSIVDTQGGFAVFSAGMAAIEISGSMYMHRHGHAKLARVVDTFSVTTGAATVLSNTQVSCKVVYVGATR
jgi:hypothetical protein